MDAGGVFPRHPVLAMVSHHAREFLLAEDFNLCQKLGETSVPPFRRLMKTFPPQGSRRAIREDGLQRSLDLPHVLARQHVAMEDRVLTWRGPPQMAARA